MFTVTVGPPLADGDVLTLLLGAEGFLFAAITLAVTLAGPDRPARRFQALKPEAVLIAAVATLVVVGLGALLAWGGLYVGGEWAGVLNATKAVILLVAIVAQPLLAALLTLAAMD